jgi:hypothetical protein
MDAATLATIAPDTAVLAVTDPRRPARDARFVEVLPNGKVTVAYDTRKGERFADVTVDAVELPDAAQADEVPVVDVNADVEQDGPTDAELIAAVDRGIEAGTLTVVDEAYLARLAADIDADAEVDAEADAQDEAAPVADPIVTAEEVTTDAEAGHTTDGAQWDSLIAGKRGRIATGEAEVSIFGLAKHLPGDVAPQQVYAAVKSARNGSHPAPVEERNGRAVIKVEAGVQWWADRVARLAERASRAGQPRVSQRQAALDAQRREIGQRLADVLAEQTGEEQAKALAELAEELLA